MGVTTVGGSIEATFRTPVRVSGVAVLWRYGWLWVLVAVS